MRGPIRIPHLSFSLGIKSPEGIPLFDRQGHSLLTKKRRALGMRMITCLFQAYHVLIRVPFTVLIEGRAIKS